MLKNYIFEVMAALRPSDIVRRSCCVGHNTVTLPYKTQKFVVIEVYGCCKADVKQTLATNADPNEMNAAFHLGLHCLPKYLFKGFQHTKG